MWADLWGKPQAVAWEALGQEHEVAMYVRRFVQAEKPTASAPVGTLVRQLGEALGLSIPGLLRNRWRIGQPETAPAARPAAPRKSARDRLTVVPADGSA